MREGALVVSRASSMFDLSYLEKTQMPPYPLTFLSIHYQTHRVCLISHAPPRPSVFSFLKQMLVRSPVSLWVFLSYEAVLIIFHLRSPLSVCVCVCVCVCACTYWYSNLFRFPLKKLASFDGLGKTTKREALTLARFLLCLSFSFLLLFAFSSLTLPTASLSRSLSLSESLSHSSFFSLHSFSLSEVFSLAFLLCLLDHLQ